MKKTRCRQESMVNICRVFVWFPAFHLMTSLQLQLSGRLLELLCAVIHTTIVHSYMHSHMTSYSVCSWSVCLALRLCVFHVCCLVVITSALDLLERLASESTYCVEWNIFPFLLTHCLVVVNCHLLFMCKYCIMTSCDCCRPMLMDLIITFVPYLSHDSLCILFELVKGLLEVQQKVLNFTYIMCVTF